MTVKIHRHLNRAMPHLLLDVGRRLPVHQQSGSKSMAEVMESDTSKAGLLKQLMTPVVNHLGISPTQNEGLSRWNSVTSWREIVCNRVIHHEPLASSSKV